jgi:predicted ATPase/DNA-binding CsgD family transcriptional regulator
VVRGTPASMDGAPVKERPVASSLTRRELDVFELMAFGLTSKEIGERLYLGRRTVETHVNRILGKLGAPTRTRAVTEGMRLGLVGPQRAVPTATSATATRNNVPIQLTTLVGREDDLREIATLLDDHRLLTLSGAGGVGKTRLALRLGVDELERYPDGVWFCDFFSIAGGSSAPLGVVAKVLGVRESTGRDLMRSVLQAVQNKEVLLIFDNCEHILDQAAQIASALLERCPNVRIVATSRQRFGITGECVQRVRSLAVPEHDETPSPQCALAFGAVALFADRARSVDGSFALSDENVGAVIEICRRLDGIPLAIELAATRMHVSNVYSVAKSLDDRFESLCGGSRTALPRQQTLRALINWSYDLLAPQERALFERLGVFGSDFGVAAVTAVCGGEGLPERDIPSLLGALQEKSLVSLQTIGREERYALLESTREYALEKLVVAGELQRYARRHAEHFRERARAADQCFGIGSPATWLQREERDLENYRAALRWSLTEGHNVPLGADIAGSLERLWFFGGVAIEAQRWIGSALQRIHEASHPAIAARLWRAKARFLQGEPMRESAERSRTLYELVDDQRGAAYALRFLAYSLLQMGNVEEASATIDRAIAAFRAHDDPVGVASCLGLQGVSAYNRHDYATGRQCYTRAIAAFKELGDDLATADVLGNLGELEFADGHPQDALRAVTASLKITTAGKEMANLAIDHNNRAAYLIAVGHLDDARRSAREALRWAKRERNAWNIAVALQHLALIAALDGRWECGALVLGYVNARYKALALEREPTEQWAYERLMAALGDGLTDGEITRLDLEGSALAEDEVTDAALQTDPVRNLTDDARYGVC